ncbi:MAG: molybdenum cofactor biosynthesis protein MoaB [Chloroflexota bacterium]|nr:molybdenum cofactor biosynthesis protein MoaB [Chloroflexota bacterium]
MTSQSVEAHREAAPDKIVCAVLTISDTRTLKSDQSGAIICETLSWRGHAVSEYQIVPDEPNRIRSLLKDWIERSDIQAILLNGGTGIAGRDTTYDVVSSLLDKRLDGFGELFRMLSFAEIGAAAMLSRALAGVAQSTVIFAMPGSTNAVRLAMEKLVGPEIAHVVFEVQK